MKKNILKLIICIMVLVAAISLTVYAAEIQENTDETLTTISEAYIPSEASQEEKKEEEVIILENIEVERVEPTKYEEANLLLNEATNRYKTAEMIYQGLIDLGYEETHPAVVMANTDIKNIKLDIEYYEEKSNILEEQYKWEVRAAEYPVATEAWLYMKNEFGWSDTVCAGIIGNLMAECGGCWTKDLDWSVDTQHGLGMIQWIGGRRSQLIKLYGNNPNVKEQLNFMKDELFGTNGVKRQVTDSQLDKIMNASSPEDCAFAFATYFERCAEQHRYPRRGYARTAYEYFVN